MSFDYKNPKVLFHGKRVDVLAVEADHPKGGVIQREVISHPGAVVILPILDKDKILLIKNERYVVQETLWELPAGTVEKGEDLEICARRELLEETGYEAGQMTKLLHFYSTPGFCNEKLYVFLAWDLVLKQQSLDDTEKIDVVALRLSQILEMIQSNTIHDAKTIATILYFHSYPINRKS